MALPVQLQSDEQVIAVLRRHPIYIVLQIIGIVLLAMLLVSLFTWMQIQVSSLGSVMNILNTATLIGHQSAPCGFGQNKSA